MQFHGNIVSSTSKGTNELIKQGAKITTNLQDILEDY
jgi:predicted Rossmann fold nucleotide-binding protein DprA/Smf involved in DNA uptake